MMYCLGRIPTQKYTSFFGSCEMGPSQVVILEPNTSFFFGAYICLVRYAWVEHMVGSWAGRKKELLISKTVDFCNCAPCIVSYGYIWGIC